MSLSGRRDVLVDPHPVPEARQDLRARLAGEVGGLDRRVELRPWSNRSPVVSSAAARGSRSAPAARRWRRPAGATARARVEPVDLQALIVAPDQLVRPSPLMSANWIVEYFEGSFQPPASPHGRHHERRSAPSRCRSAWPPGMRPRRDPAPPGPRPQPPAENTPPSRRIARAPSHLPLLATTRLHLTRRILHRREAISQGPSGPRTVRASLR